jgi:hypothetical protein
MHYLTKLGRICSNSFKIRFFEFKILKKIRKFQAELLATPVGWYDFRGGFFEQTPSWRPGASEITSPAGATWGRTQIGFFKDWKGELWGWREREGDLSVKNA